MLLVDTMTMVTTTVLEHVLVQHHTHLHLLHLRLRHHLRLLLVLLTQVWVVDVTETELFCVADNAMEIVAANY
jgi:hypothetical protein